MRAYKSTASAFGIGFLLATSSLSHADEAKDYSPLQRAMQKVLADREAANEPVFAPEPSQNQTQSVEITQPEPSEPITEAATETVTEAVTENVSEPAEKSVAESVSETPSVAINNMAGIAVPFVEQPLPYVLSYAPATKDPMNLSNIFDSFSLSQHYNLPSVGQLNALPPSINDLTIGADEEKLNEGLPESSAETPTTQFNDIAAITNFDKPQYIVIDLQSGESILSLHADEQRQPASLVKVMTLWLAMDAIKDKTLTTTTRLPVPAGTARLSQGAAGTLNTRNTYTVAYLMNQAGTRSNAYATVALAVGVAKAQKWVSEDASADDALDAFVARMNDKAAAHDMNKTIFGNVTGMRTNYSTPRDMAKMFAQIYKEHPALFRDSLGGKTHTSRFQRNFDSAIGSKTGTLNQCGLCLGSVYTKNGRTYVMVIFGMDSHIRRFGQAQNLYAKTPEIYLPTINVPLPVARPNIEGEKNNITAGATALGRLSGPI